MTQAGGAAWTRDTSQKSNMYEKLVGSAIVAGTSIPSVDSGQKFASFEKYDHANHLYRQDILDYSNQASHQGLGSGAPENLRLASAHKAPTNCLWLGGLDPTVHYREELRTFFDGWPGFCDISMPDNGGYFAFASFETVEDAVEAKNFIARKFHFHVSGKPIKVNFGRQTTPVTRNEPRISPEIASDESKQDLVTQEPPNMDQEDLYDEDNDVQSAVNEIADQEHVINEDVSYYDDPEGEHELNRNEIDEVVEKVDRVRRTSGREELRDCLKRKRAKSKEALQVILKRIIHLYSHDTHKKLMVLYAVGDFFYCLPPHRRYDIGEAIGENIIEFLSIMLAHQCEKGKGYVSDVAASLYFYFKPAVRKKLEIFIDIEVLVDLKQDEVVAEETNS